MVPQDFAALSAGRAARARLLSERYPAAAEVLRFYAELVSLQRDIFPEARDRDELVAFRQDLVDLVLRSGPELLRETARELDEAACRRALTDYWRQLDTSSPRSFFARAAAALRVEVLRVFQHGPAGASPREPLSPVRPSSPGRRSASARRR